MQGRGGFPLSVVVAPVLVRVEDSRADVDAQAPRALGRKSVVRDEIEERRHDALAGSGGRRRPQSDLLEFPVLAKKRSRCLFRRGATIQRVESAVLLRQKAASRDECLLREKRGHQPRQRAAKLVELDRGRSPCGKSTRRLTAGGPERDRHRGGTEATEAAPRGSGPEWSDRAGPMPPALAEGDIVHTRCDPCCRFKP